jgi:hypothetical protein
MDRKIIFMSAIIVILMTATIYMFAMLINSNTVINSDNREALVGIKVCLDQHSNFDEYHRCAYGVLTERLSK